MVERVRWGVLGAANIALKKVVPGMQRSELCDVVAIASRDLSKARAAAAGLGLERAYGSYQELLDDPDIEAIYNPLPNHLHVPWSIAAMEAGKHVLCEKPISLNASQARELLAARERTGRLVMEAFMVRTHPRWLKIRELVHGGALGELRLVIGHFSYSKYDENDVRNKVEWGGGGLLDIGCYPITMSRYLFNAEPLRVCGLIERDPRLGVDRLATAMLQFEKGHAHFSSATQLAPLQFMHIFGTEHRISMDSPFSVMPDEKSKFQLDNETIEFEPRDHYATQGDQFSRAVRGLGQLAVPLEDSIANMAVIDAIFRSAESGAWEDVDFPTAPSPV